MSWWHKTNFPGGNDLTGDPSVRPYGDSDTDETSARTSPLPLPSPADKTIPGANSGAAFPILDELREEQRRQEQLAEQPVFTTGELLLIRGGLFKIHAITTKRMYLDFQGPAGQLMQQNES